MIVINLRLLLEINTAMSVDVRGWTRRSLICRPTSVCRNSEISSSVSLHLCTSCTDIFTVHAIFYLIVQSSTVARRLQRQNTVHAGLPRGLVVDLYV